MNIKLYTQHKPKNIKAGIEKMGSTKREKERYLENYKNERLHISSSSSEHVEKFRVVGT